METRTARMVMAQLSHWAPSGLARLCGPRWMAMSGGQPRYARTPAPVYGQQHTFHGASACGSLTTASKSLHRVILAEHVSRACCGIMCAEVHKGFYGLHHAVTEKVQEHDSCLEHHCLLQLLHVSLTAKARPCTWEYSGLYAPDHRERYECSKRIAESFAARLIVQDYMMQDHS